MPIIPEKTEKKKLNLLEQVRLDVGLVSRDPMSSDPNAMDIGERGDSGYKPSFSKKKSKKGDKDKGGNNFKLDKSDKKDKKDKKRDKKDKKKKKSHRTRADDLGLVDYANQKRPENNE